jgi:hypothetical protein
MSIATTLSDVPPDITFEGAIKLTQEWLQWQGKNPRSGEKTRQFIRNLVATENGARGFFVVYLTATEEIAEYPSIELIESLRECAPTIAELLVKNLAMSSAQAIYHQRQNNDAMVASSSMVSKRTANLIHILNIPATYHYARELSQSAQTGSGNYQSFLDRWKYDPEQRQAIVEVFDKLFANIPRISA